MHSGRTPSLIMSLDSAAERMPFATDNNTETLPRSAPPKRPANPLGLSIRAAIKGTRSSLLSSLNTGTKFTPALRHSSQDATYAADRGLSASYTRVTFCSVACACTGTQSNTARMAAMPATPLATKSRSCFSSIDDISPMFSSKMDPYPRPITWLTSMSAPGAVAASLTEKSSGPWVSTSSSMMDASRLTDLESTVDGEVAMQNKGYFGVPGSF
mmetsp:Transcript_43907/g.83850  ORF Transcript_43907/g.83850 Transcript_43907/m.83850 type:complete len:214 (+) Transcript_43907:134-775(+)